MLERLGFYLVYILLMIVGIGLALVLFFLGAFFGGDVDGIDNADFAHDFSDLGGDVSGDALMHDGGAAHHLGFLKLLSPSFFSLVIAMTGAFGIFFLSIKVPSALVMPISIVAAFIVTSFLSKTIYSFIRSSPSLQSIKRFEGVEGIATLDIGPGEKIGEVEVLLDDRKYYLSARSYDGSFIPKGTPVRVMKTTTSILLVRSLEEKEESKGNSQKSRDGRGSKSRKRRKT